ncbi:class I SAM-dependent methyltransferase [Stutzerimonas stutzeri]|uniref:class I SAM-dependent methyltransferase n=1 Tax=Stutzerimonas stutzeri TaxID=316 RepID=UPI003D04E5CE
MPASVVTRLPILRALLAQLLALLVVWLLLLGLVGVLGVRPGLILVAVAQGCLAALIGARLGLSAWWLVINLMFVPGLVLLRDFDVPGWLPLGAFMLLLLLNWNAFTERVPLYLTGREAERELRERLAMLPRDFRYIDLGSGLAGTLSRLAREFPSAQFVGVETAPLPFVLSWLRCLTRRNCHIRLISLWRVDLGEYDVVYCFLSPAPMAALWEKAQAEMRSGALLISNSFEVPGVEPAEVLHLDDWRGSRLLIWCPGGATPDGAGTSG